MLTASSRRLSWVLATLMVVALPGVKSTFAAMSSAQILSSQLPAGVTLSKATVKQTASALHEAVAKNHDAAVSLLDAAITAKSKGGNLSCGGVSSLVDAAKSSAPEKSRELTEAAMSMKPECGDALSQGARAGSDTGGGILGSVGQAAGEEAQGFGAGLGAGFPGSPGFIGSAPSGAFAGFAPVVVNPVTTTTNQ